MSTRALPAEEVRRAALFVATLASFLTPFMGSSIFVALPAMGVELNMNAVLLGWVPTAYLLAASVLLIPFGRLADIHGRKLFFLAGMCIYTLGSLLLGLAPHAALVIPFRVVQGVGGAMLFGTGIAIITSVFPHGERGRALGINSAAVYLGLSLGPPIGGVLTQQFGWRSIFLVNVPIGLFVILLGLVKLKGKFADAQGETFDIVGALLFSVTLVSLMLGFSFLPAWYGAALLAAGLLCLAAFSFWETHAVHPLLDVRLLLRNRPFAFSNLAALLAYTASAGTGFLLSLYLQHVRALSPQQAGLVLVSQPVMMALFSPPAGRISDRREPRAVASAGLSLVGCGLFMLIFLGRETPLAYVVGALLCLGLGFAFFSSPNTNAVMSSVESRTLGVASATLATMRATGQTFSVGIATMIFAVVIGRVQLGPAVNRELLASTRVAFVVFAALCAAGVIASASRGRIHA